jgi:hypothetical protein
MNRRALASYLSVTLAVVAGIVGMGICFNAVLAGNLHELSLGMPLLLIGLWWAGHELGRSMIASRRRAGLGQVRNGQRAKHRAS